MYNGYRSNSPGHDVGPYEDRFSQGTPVDLLTFHENEEGGMDIGYQQVFVARRPNEIFYEPIDETPDHDDSDVTNAMDSRYLSESNRLHTFRNRWLDDYHVSPNDLAKNGFIHIGPGDKVKCVFCLRCLRNWEPRDSVENEHRRNYPDCPFVRGECHNLNIPLNSTENMTSFGYKIQTYRPVEVPSMQDFSQRLKSFDTWPKHSCIRPDVLVEAGLFYAGTKDKVTCFSCGKSIANWEPGDDPWLEHAKWSPDCPYVHSMKGVDFVEKIQKQIKKPLNETHEHSVEQESNTQQVEKDMNVRIASAGNTVKHSKEEVNTSQSKAQTSSQSSHKPHFTIDKELNTIPVKAIIENYGISVEEMRVILEKTHLKGEKSLEKEPVHTILQHNDIPVEAIRDMLNKLRLT